MCCASRASGCTWRSLAVGHYGITTILACEAVTMATILVLWSVALWRGDPRARGMVIALAVSMVAGTTRALPNDVTRTVGLDPVSVYHLAQVPAMVMLCLALRARDRSTSPGAAMSDGAQRFTLSPP